MPSPTKPCFPAFDARADRLDLRDRQYAPGLRALPGAFPDALWMSQNMPAYLAAGLVLNQGADGACTGFGLAAVINLLYWRLNPAQPPCSPRMLYHLAKFYDEWPGEDYSGSSCRGALKGWHKHGVCQSQLWPYTIARNGSAPNWESARPGWEADAESRPLGSYYRIDKNSISDIQAAIVEAGAVYVSGNAHSGWGLHQFKADTSAPLLSLEQLPLIRIEEKSIGGHAFAFIGYTADGFVLQNSWGRDWAYQGLAILSYADWLASATDAWAVGLGVPERHLDSANEDAGPNDGVPALRRQSLQAYARARSKRRGALNTDQAYAQTVVIDNNGAAVQRLLAFADAAAATRHIAHTAPLAWYRQQAQATPLRLVLYALGGLGDEASSLDDVARLAPYFLANGMYPLFLCPLNGLSDAIVSLLRAEFGSDTPPHSVAERQAQDSSIEAYAESSGGKALWIQVKQAAQQAALNDTPPRALYALAKALQQLQKDCAGSLEIHLIAHSAGAHLCGWLLDLLKFSAPKTCTLYAPACSIAFANQHFLPALISGTLARENFHLHVLADTLEQHDEVAGLYHQSWLYLIARSLENRHKTPLLGMACSVDADFLSALGGHPAQWNHSELAALRKWQHHYWDGKTVRGFATGSKPLSRAHSSTLHVQQQAIVNSGHHTLRASHTSFDRDILTVTATLRRIAGLKASQPLPCPVDDLS
ncbi:MULTISPECIES: C1 family peptidase [unclassified Undibacterium]|uniref:C1 family peptidase n=1 Tax=unclassified Undibacterium TaxID=2630295 RepID=UPI002AC918B5|nr:MULTISPECIES: C1 family peptidase [unclassified Undibacterium]MEB0138863.1 C1 family peptidase [Undibacterium sp. CCC2.1]MEB0172275.1 C1 family peptidase [Undibacterium sp. CCC1.1]MEB0176108.1 C1 family peptidase [Undibacterium sp. CCC3.4]MEB0215931.1 C1 family peptidase [Undibacterium sp. 5I2]WPX44751.1 C1 family peptidase [Undibacterium sp. CCC3.4]